ncbi:type II toxin-antitoxin system CcdA family antitoxin [Oricola sp.]|uniref:type II toxin-antitoxin system CcdA family antitoxin n=1 Tax=Oricola sp. TaxID=1979950 RepID=UPI003516CA87
MKNYSTAKKTSANLSVASELIEEAKALGINLSREAEKGIADAVREEKTRRWKEDNAEAIADANRYVAEHGLPLAKYRMF